MAYYVRSDAPSGRYIRTDVPEGRYLVHSAEGTTWAKGHKYVDKRWIQGAWHYLYPEMLEAAKRAGDAVKDTAKKATDTVKETAKNVKATAEKKVEETKKAAREFKNYSKEVDIKSKGAKQTADAQKKRQEEAAKEMNQSVLDGGKASNTKDEAEKEIEDIHDRWHNGKVVNQQEVKDAHDKKESAEKAIEESHRRNQQAAEDYQDARDRAGTAKNEYENAEAEKETAKYKASKALNDVIDGATGATKQAAQWLKNQLNSGADWTTDQIEKIRESDAVASLAGKLENLYANSNSGATKKGLSILSQIIGWGKLEAPKKSSSSSSNRTYSGTGTKAQRREAVDGGPVSNNDYSNRPKKRR